MRNRKCTIIIIAHVSRSVQISAATCGTWSEPIKGPTAGRWLRPFFGRQMFLVILKFRLLHPFVDNKRLPRDMPEMRDEMCPKGALKVEHITWYAQGQVNTASRYFAHLCYLRGNDNRGIFRRLRRM